jgi:hypothetical protein
MKLIQNFLFLKWNVVESTDKYKRKFLFERTHSKLFFSYFKSYTQGCPETYTMAQKRAKYKKIVLYFDK